MAGPAVIPRVVRNYFSANMIGWKEWGSWPLIHEGFTPGKGWKRLGFNKRASISWLRKMRAAGVTHVSFRAMSHPNRIVDFPIREVINGGR